MKIKSKNQKYLNLYFFIYQMLFQIKKYIIFLFFILIIITINKNYYFIHKKNIQICLCTLGKEENKYVREYINHYFKYGVDKIFIYDNNDINGESFDLAIQDYCNFKNNSELC